MTIEFPNWLVICTVNQQNDRMSSVAVHSKGGDFRTVFLIPDMTFHISQPLHSRLQQFFWLMVSAHAYSTLELSDAVPLLAKLLLESESWGHVWKSPTLRKSSPLPYKLSISENTDTHVYISVVW